MLLHNREFVNDKMHICEFLYFFHNYGGVFLSMFYERFVDLCNEKGMSPTAAIQAIGLSTGNLKNWKNGRIPKPDVLDKIVGFFDVSIDYLLGKTNIKKPLVNNDEELTEYLYYLKTRPELRMLFKVSSKATKEDVEQAVRIIEAIRNDNKDEPPAT